MHESRSNSQFCFRDQVIRGTARWRFLAAVDAGEVISWDAGLATRGAADARNAGLDGRPLAQTARETLAWLETASGHIVGLTGDEERDVLAAWHARAEARSGTAD